MGLGKKTKARAKIMKGKAKKHAGKATEQAAPGQRESLARKPASSSSKERNQRTPSNADQASPAMLPVSQPGKDKGSPRLRSRNRSSIH